LRETVREQAAGHPHIDFLGRLDRSGVRGWMQRAHVLVAPGQETGGSREASGQVMLEAQACGTPVLAYRTGGLPEMLQDQATGLLADEAEFAQLRDSLLQLLTLDGAAYRRMRQAARRFAAGQRSLEEGSRQLDEHYRQVRALA
jgi:glycosyltransferase involved in cell wall biosynthesis